MPGVMPAPLALIPFPTPVQALPTTYFHRGRGEGHSLVPEDIAGQWPSPLVPPLQHPLSAKGKVELCLAFSYHLLITPLKIARQEEQRGADRSSTKHMRM